MIKEGMLAASDGLQITVKGLETHGSIPWGGVDPIAAAAQIVNALQQIVSRQVDISNAPAVVTVGSINGGKRGNIIPEEVVMTGTIRTFDMDMRKDMHERGSASGQAMVTKPIMGAEDFSYYANEIPGLFFGLGVAKEGEIIGAPNHLPYFYVNDAALPVGIEALANLALVWLYDQQ